MDLLDPTPVLNQQISLDETDKTPQTVSLDMGVLSPASLPQDVADRRAYKVSQGLGPLLGKSYKDISDDITSGQEGSLRQQAASTLDYKNIVGRQEAIKDATLRKGMPLTNDEVGELFKPQKPVNPNSVVEDAYGHSVVNTLDEAHQNMGTSVLGETMEIAPGLVGKIKEQSGTLLSSIERARTEAENLQTQMDQQGWLGWSWNFAETFFQPYPELKLRGLVDSQYFAGGGIGSNLDAQTSALLGKPIEEQNAFWDGDAWKKLKADNPQVASMFLRSFLGQSITDRYMNDTLTYGMVAGAAGESTKLAKIVKNISTLRSGARDVIEAANLPHANKATILQAAGDSKGAAVEQMVANTASEVKGATPDYLTKRAVDAMSSTMRSDATKFTEGSAGREIVNRLDQNSEATIAAMQNRAEKLVKTPRGQEVVENKEAWKEIIQDQKDKYKGPGSSLMDSVGNFYDARSNTYYVLHKLGRESGEYFANPEEAIGWGFKNGFMPKISDDYYKGVSSKIEDLQNNLDASLTQGFDDAKAMKRHINMQDELEVLLRHKADIDRIGKDGFPIFNDGLGHYIGYFQPVEETGKVYNKYLAKTTESKLQEAWLNGISRWIRTPLETMSKYDNQARIIAATGPGRLLEDFKGFSKPIDRLPRKDWPELERALQYAQKAIDPVSGINGHYFDTLPELEAWWNTTHGHLPSDAQIEAYHAFKQNYLAERELRITQKYTGKVRVGAQQHRIYIKDYSQPPGSTKFAKGKDISSDFFDGILQKEAPGGDSTIMVIGKNATDVQFMQANSPKFWKIKKEITEGNSGGWQSLRLFDPDEGDGPLRDFANTGDKRIRYVVTQGRVDTKPLDYNNQVGKAGGGHLVYDYPNNLKLPNMTYDEVADHWNYAGDRTVMAVEHKIDGHAYAKHMDRIYDHMAEHEDGLAQQYHQDNELGMAWEDLKSWYRPSKNAEGKTKPALLRTIKDPQFRPRFTVVPRNQLSVDLNKDLEKQYGKRFKDRTRQGSDARQASVEFTGERDALDFLALDNRGTSANPMWNHEPANVIDPIPAYNRGLNRIISSSFNNDYKTAAVQRWLAQANDAGMLDVKDEDILRNPYPVFAEPPWKKGADKIQKSALLSARFNINQFIGVPSVVDNYLNALVNRMVESIYKKSPTASNLIAHAWELPYIRNPIAFGRTVTFHLGMGLFSIPQLFMQMTTGANVLAIGGAKHFESAMSGSYFYYLSRLNKTPEILEDLDKKAQKFGWRPGEFKEFKELMDTDTGATIIGGEHAFVDTPFSSKIVMNGGQKILDWGEMPFRGGARNTRILAGAMAYKEFREGPMTGRTFTGTQISRRGSQFGRLTKEDKASIMDRWSDLDHNMTRAGSSILHTGVMSPFGQFTAYSLRLAELMGGKRLTWQEKTRLFATSSVLYGLPVGGLGLMGLPVSDYLRQKAKEAGHDLDDNFVEHALNRGLPSVIMGMITGTDYDFEKFGAKGWEPANNLLWTSSPVWQAFGGAMFSKGLNLYAETGAIRRGLISHMNGSQDPYPVTADDVLGFFYKEASFPNALVRALYALRTANWISKSGTVLQQDVPAGQALFQTLTGVVDTKISDITVSVNALAARKAADVQTEKLYIEAVHNWIRAMDEGNQGEAETYWKQSWYVMNVIGDYPMNKRAGLISRAVEDRVDLVTRLEHQFTQGSDVPASKEQDYLQMHMNRRTP
jgi:hypothetical protein